MPYGGIFDIGAVQERIQELDSMAAFPEFWADQERSTAILREKAGLEKACADMNVLTEGLEEAEVLHELAEEGNDTETFAEAIEILKGLETAVEAAENKRLLSEEHDKHSAILDINSGAGGTDASDWAEILMRMYLQWAKNMGYKTSILAIQGHDEAGIKSCSIEVQGDFAYGYLQAEIGVHRLVRISPFDSAGQRHTAFASVSAVPDINDDIEIEINDSDLRIDTFRASGAGGQHVNTTDSAVRITHLPTGLVVSCQNERSQHKNKARAMKLLRAKMYQQELSKRMEAASEANSQKLRIEWGSQIRSYVFHPYKLVKDNRTGIQTSNVDKFLNGDLLDFMNGWLAYRANFGKEEAE